MKQNYFRRISKKIKINKLSYFIKMKLILKNGRNTKKLSSILIRLHGFLFAILI